MSLPTDLLIGADEVGYGSIAGPLVVCAVLATREQNDGLIHAKDSKVYGKNNRYKTTMPLDINRSQYLDACLVSVCPNDVCRWGYEVALSYGFRLSVATLRRRVLPRYPIACIDGSGTKGVRYAKSYVSGDRLWPVISLASCLAKTYQLAAMQVLHAEHPGYGFGSHAGYGCPYHITAIQRHGILANNHRVAIVLNMKGMRGVHLIPSPALFSTTVIRIPPT